MGKCEAWVESVGEEDTFATEFVGREEGGAVGRVGDGAAQVPGGARRDQRGHERADGTAPQSQAEDELDEDE